MRSLCWLLALTTLSGCGRWGFRSRQALPAPEGLAIGSVAPEIQGRDMKGVPFNLSDYKGRVVILDFWGQW
jgi:cytochrome oxidase Cu insertion factor (SCO1/SenC/PrrC family)